MNTIQTNRYDFLESNPHFYNNKNNCAFDRPYIIDFSPLTRSYKIDSFDQLIERNLTDSVSTPYTLLIQVALAHLDSCFSLVRTPPGRSQFNKLIKYIFSATQITNETAVFIHNHPKREYGLNAGWSSAMTQGQALSLWLRIITLGDDFEDIQHIGPMILNGMLKTVEEGGGLYKEKISGNFWLEEYPSTPPSHVLNGFIFAFFGLLEFNRHHHLAPSEDHRSIEIHLCRTLLNNISRYDRFGWSCYDLAKRNFAPTLYHLIHVYTLNYLSLMLNCSELSSISDKWRNGIKLNKYKAIDALRIIYATRRKAYVKLVCRRW